MKNILLVGAGRRVNLARAFKDKGFNVFAYETSYEVPIYYDSSLICGKKWKDPEIIGDLSKVIIDNEIDVVLPLMDEATLVCSHLKNLSNWPMIVTADPKATEICLNKDLFEIYMLKHFPLVYPKYEPKQECIVKPIQGFGSKGIKTYSSNWPDIEFIPSKEVIQRLIRGQEYSVDAYFDRNSNYIDGIVRQRSRVFDGEVISSMIDFQPELTDLVKVIGEDLKLVGPICAQFIIEEETHKPFITEINARFGGGVTLSIKAGMLFIYYLEEEYVKRSEEKLPISHNKQYLKVERYLCDTFFDQTYDWFVPVR
jgi:carbamoyl-phosphate synthase large subunit